MKRLSPLPLAGIVCVGLFLFAAPIPALAQACPLCYTQAASAGARMIQALRSGILVLILPPMFMWIGLGVVAYRRRNRFRDADQTAGGARSR